MYKTQFLAYGTPFLNDWKYYESVISTDWCHKGWGGSHFIIFDNKVFCYTSMPFLLNGEQRLYVLFICYFNKVYKQLKGIGPLLLFIEIKFLFIFRP